MPVSKPNLALHSAILTVLAALIPAPLFAADQDGDEPQEAPTPADDFHQEASDSPAEIIVTGAKGVSQFDVIAGIAVMSGDNLQRNMSGQIGDVLAHMPGVSTSGFAPGASRPVLRGLQGERVRVLVDGIGAIDASNTSADHAAAIDPLTAEKIEVLRGPAVLLYGSQAIGGAVNVIDKRIPLRPLSEPFHFDGALAADSASNLREGGASLDLPLGQTIVIHADGAHHQTGDMAIAGRQMSPIMLKEFEDAIASGDASSDDLLATALGAKATKGGHLENSAAKTWSANTGIAFFQGESNIGGSFGVYDTAYGTPTRPSLTELSDEMVTIALHQKRADMRGNVTLGEGFFHSLSARAGYSDYTHTEFEGGQSGTTFKVQGFEGRATLMQHRRGSWGGSIGAQYYERDFEAIGEEAYVPQNLSKQFAVFALQEFAISELELEIAGRLEKTHITSAPSRFNRQFDTMSLALSAAYETSDGMRLGVNISRAERAPSAEELLSNGAHIATGSYEVGSTALTPEKAMGIEAYLRGNLAPDSLNAQVNLAVYRNNFSQFIYQQASAQLMDGLPVQYYRQGKARNFGIEGEVTLPLISLGEADVTAELGGDYIRASLKDGTPLPRTPPLSLKSALEAKLRRFDFRLEGQWNGAQKRTAPLETPSDDFVQLNAALSWRPLIAMGEQVSLMLQANNITNSMGRRHTSFTKDYVPIMGRNFKLSLRMSI